MPRSSRDDSLDWDDESLEPDSEPESDSDSDADTIPCPSCGADIHEDSVRCPACGDYVSDSGQRKPWWVIAGAFLCLFIVYRWLTWR